MTLDDVKTYLRIEIYNLDEDSLLTELMEVSEIYIDSCVGEDYKSDTKAIKLAELVQKKIISDMYENRSPYIPEKTKQDRIVTTILDKLSNMGSGTV